MAGRKKRATPDETDSVKAWDRLPGEGVRSYECFCFYRDAGPERKMDRVFRAFEKAKGRVVAEQKRCSSTWWEWYRLHDWKTRAEQYDGWLERQSRMSFEAEHRKRVEAFSERQRQISIAVQNVGLRMLQVALAELKKAEGSQAEGEHTLTPQRFAQYTRTAAVMVQWGSEAEANALGVDEMLNMLNESEV